MIVRQYVVVFAGLKKLSDIKTVICRLTGKTANTAVSNFVDGFIDHNNSQFVFYKSLCF